MLTAALGYIGVNEDKKQFEKLYYAYRNLIYKSAFDILQKQQYAFISIAKKFQNIRKKCPQIKSFVVIIIRIY